MGNQDWQRYAFIAGVCGFLLGVFYAHLPAKGEWQPGWNMLSAVGTVAAVWAAVWISTKDDRRRNEEAKVQAVLVAARHINPLFEISDTLKFVVASARSYEQIEHTPEQYDLIVALLRDSRLDMSHSDLTALAYLPNHTAYRLCRAKENILTSVRYLERNQDMFHANSERSGPMGVMAFVADVAEYAQKDVRKAADACQNMTAGDACPPP